MSDDYLWDGSGEPDPEVQRLEALLGRFRHEDARKFRPLGVRRTGRVLPFIARSTWAAPGAVAAAAILLGVLGIWLVTRRPVIAWEVVRLAGEPKVGSSRIGASGSLPVGEWIETDGASRAGIKVGIIGEAEIEPNTRVRLVKAGLTEHRLALARGTLHAKIWAPPRLFFVETPSAVAVDLGCAYTLSVDERGASLLRVETGWVAFDLERRESFVPAGALCATRPGIGPGTPYFADASGTFRDALTELDFATNDPASRERLLGVVLDEARERDAFTLWHLLSRLSGADRGRVYERLAALAAPPRDVTRAGIEAGDKRMIDQWWDELGLGVTTWWRLWKSPGPPLAR